MLFQHAFLSFAHAVLIAWNALPSFCEVSSAYPLKHQLNVTSSLTWFAD